MTGTTKRAASFYAGTTNPDGTTRLNYDGYLYATRVYNAIYNDYADYWGRLEDGEIPIPGKVYIIIKGMKVTIASKRADKRALGVCTADYGIAMGKAVGEVPISVAGFVQAFVDKVYKPGTRLVNNKHGDLTKARFWERSLAKFITEGENNKCWVKVE